jgi:hypothetical protein
MAEGVELAKRLRWQHDGLAVVDALQRSTLHRWGTIDSLRITRGRWSVIDVDVGNPWFDTIPIHVEAVVGDLHIRRRVDRDRLVRFGRHVLGVDPDALKRPLTGAFLTRDVWPLLRRGGPAG